MKNSLLFLFSLFLLTLKAQNGFTTYTTNLTVTGTIKYQSALLVDHNNNKWIGFMTIGGNAGLVKYDNTSWTIYSTSSTPALPSNNVTALEEDNLGNIWIGTNVGLVKFDGSVFTTYNVSNGIANNAITCIEAVGNQLYIGTLSGLSRFDGLTFTNYNLSNTSLPNDTILCIQAETPNVLWLGGSNRLVEFNINNTYTSTSYINHLITGNPGLINCLHIDSQNAKWLGTTNVGILKYSGTSFMNADSLYSFFGSMIPKRVVDITSGLHNGVLFVHDMYGHGATGMTELAPNGMVYQYFYYLPSQKIGYYVENIAGTIFISQGSKQTNLGPGYSYVAPKMYYTFNESNYTMPIGTVNVNNFKILDINNVRAGIANVGDMHRDAGGDWSAMYEVPKGSGKNSNYGSDFWIGGLDNNNQLYLAGNVFRQHGIDYWPGPLDTINATVDSATARKYDKIWKVSYNDINTFISAFNTGSVVATQDMLTWPAHGTGNNSRNLAPFVDRNSDGIYNPYDGDYPKIKGDQALYFIFNDNLAAHGSLSGRMGIEVQGMAYAYGCPASVSGHPELMYSTFYDYKIINRSATNYHDVLIGMFDDVEIGDYLDDYVGCNVAENYAFGYNGNTTDNIYGHFTPAQGTKILKGPLANLSDGVDNDNDSAIDEAGEECKLNKFTYCDRLGTYPRAEPSYGPEYYNYMAGHWQNGAYFTCGGNGYGGTVNTNWAYSGDPGLPGVNTDPSNTCSYWTQITAGSNPNDQKMVLGAGPFDFNSGETIEIEYAYVTSFDSSQMNNNLISVAKLKTDMQNLNAFYNQVNKPNCLQSITVGVTEVLRQNDFTLYPNPAKSLITLQSTIEGPVKIDYEIVDVLGKTVMQNQNNNNTFSVTISDLNAGIYFIRLKMNNSLVVKKFVKE